MMSLLVETMRGKKKKRMKMTKRDMKTAVKMMIVLLKVSMPVVACDA